VILLGGSVAGISEVIGAFGGSEVAEELADVAPGGPDRTRISFAQ
jgi:hypothetical protein